MNAELKRRILSDSGIGVPFAQTKILNLNLEYAMTTRVIALDLDGTLLTPKKTLLPSSIEALARAREAGYRLIIVHRSPSRRYSSFLSGRWRWIHLLFAVTAPICMIIMAKTVLEADPMPVNKALQLIEMLNETPHSRSDVCG
ncbi:Phosphotransferase [Escherichia coli]|uniref:Phosphotransferase n=1 Tax=Escherichia coli TaxID=562 RepID=A0A377KBT6_ECOLX|nr:Phosphotransferase [Escherichia coli]